MVKLAIQENGRVSMRELFVGLEYSEATKFTDWSKQFIKIGNEYYFKEELDFSVRFGTNAQFTEEEIIEMSPQKRSSYGINIDYEITIDMAKHICLTTGTDKGFEYRQYLIKTEGKYIKMREDKLLLENKLKDKALKTVLSDSMELTHKSKLAITNDICYPILDVLQIKNSKLRAIVHNKLKNKLTGGKYENIKKITGFNAQKFELDYRNTAIEYKINHLEEFNDYITEQYSFFNIS